MCDCGSPKELEQIRRAERAEREAAKYWEMLGDARDQILVLESALENYKYVVGDAA